uniref:Putative secreted protein n=1 Tax=Anopheles darlingi TaxID=43151 RepID=A0A2M4DJL3_ANODA
MVTRKAEGEMADGSLYACLLACLLLRGASLSLKYINISNSKKIYYSPFRGLICSYRQKCIKSRIRNTKVAEKLGARWLARRLVLE